MPTSPDLPAIKKLEDYGNIAQALSVVEQLRQQRQTSIDIAQRTQALRQWQATRFRGTYADVLRDSLMGPAALFFLTELYSEKEYSQRDAQFARIAGALERLFPQSVVQTATLLAKLHALSETLDACMALAWAADFPQAQELDLSTYKRLWQSLHDTPNYTQAREQQIFAMQELGKQLERHTKVAGLRLMLKIMRGPATAAGLQDLQRFLECGFDTFGQLSNAGRLPQFLNAITERETAWLIQMSA